MSTLRTISRLLPWGLLAVSLAAHLFLLDRDRKAPARPPGRHPAAPRGITATADAPDTRECEARLGPLLAAERVRLTQALGWLSGRAPAREAPDEAARETRREDADQEDALCRVAKRQLREHWASQREALTASLRRSLSDPKELSKGAAEEAGRLALAAGLGAADQAAFGDRYAPIRQKRLDAVLAAVRREPPAFDAALEEVLGLFADEDRLIAELGGEKALRRMRDGRCESRTAIAAIAAALADLPWDESIRW